MYDSEQGAGDLVVGTMQIPQSERSTLNALLREIDESPLGPVVTSAGEQGDSLKVAVPSSVPVDEVLLSHAIDSHPNTLWLAEC